MILLLAFVVSILMALARGGRLTALAKVPFRHGWAAMTAFALQIIVIYFPLPVSAGLASPRALLLMSSYALLLFVVWANYRLPGMILVGAGLAMNLLVMAANGGYMPITSEAVGRAGLQHLVQSADTGARLMATKDILLPRDQTRFWFLSDVFAIPSSWPVSSVFSIGDVVLALGVFWFFQRTLLARDAVTESTVLA